jgi:hypothetical protein
MKKAFLLIALFGMGMSPAVFGQAITVVTPNGGEQWVLGSTQSIAWQTTPSTRGNVLIKLIKNNGDEVGTIAENISVSSSPYLWTVGQLKSNAVVQPGTDYKIRVRVIDTRDFDASDNVFSIKAEMAPNLTVCITNGKTAPVFGDRDIHVWIKNNSTIPVSGLTLEFYIEGKGTNTYAVSLGPKGIDQKTRKCSWSTKGEKTVRARVKLSNGSQLVELKGVVIVYLNFLNPTNQWKFIVICSDGTQQNEPVL